MVTEFKGRDSGEPVKLLDAAYWIKGCSSLGPLRYTAMPRVGKAEGDSLCLLDIKEAATAAAPRSTEMSMPRDNAVRVVEGAKSDFT